jgi:3-methyladenine DNA glycosylase/8-oxoguanine DNA glycosylase
VRDLAAPELSAIFALDHPFDLRATLWQARFGPTDPCVRLIHDDVWRATRTPLGPATERLRLVADGSISVDAWGPGAEWLVQRAPVLCGSLDDARAFAPLEPYVQRLSREHAGLRIGRTEAVFETAMATVLEQRVATADAWQSWRHLVHTLGERAPGPLHGLWLPPSAARIARTPYEVFHRFGIERRQADVLRRLAIVAQRLEETTSLSLDAAYRRLQAVPGIGPWTSARVGLIALGDADAVMIGDLHLPHLVSWSLAGERRGTDERMLELLEPFRGHRGRVIRLLLLGSAPGQRVGGRFGG